MAKEPRGKRLEAAMEALRAAAGSLADTDLMPHLCEALRSGSGHLAKQAATIAQSRAIRGIREDLETAMTCFLRHPENDRGCLAKEAIARLLIEELETDDEVWLSAARHVQMEASFGPSIDTAAGLRGMAAIGIAAGHLPHKVNVLIDLLLDQESAARAGAVRALGYLGTAEALSLVRYKTLLGDAEIEVVGECFRALLPAAEDAPANLALVAGYLSHGADAIAGEAALALGESRNLRALDFLMQALDHTASAERRATLLRAVALLRREEAFGRLALWLNDASPRVQAEARAALHVFRGEPALTFFFA
ncbi:MAG: hypothetical protein KIT83_12540 [Bryobacterales bacterium]|nr:hypothetical protein [Bryobacterales bacterium]